MSSGVPKSVLVFTFHMTQVLFFFYFIFFFLKIKSHVLMLKKFGYVQ